MSAKIKRLALLGAVVLLATASAQAAGYSLVHSFGVLTNVSGFQPLSTMVQDGSGTLYGTTSISEGNLTGTVFKIQPNGTGFKVLASFSGTNNSGAKPFGGLVLSGTTLYGTTIAGGTAGTGTIFSVNTDGTGFTVLTNFAALNGVLADNTGANPYGGLVLSGSTLYGTTQAGGSGASGTVFSVNINGTGLTVLKNFTGSDGATPDGTLVISGNVLYGTTLGGGSHGFGTVFAVNASTLGFTNLYNFTAGNDGSHPYAGLTLAGGWLFGTASSGGSSTSGTVFALTTSGSIFSNVYTFTGGSDGAAPFASLILSGNTLYGTANQGGATGFGTVFSVNTNGTGFTTLCQFDGDVSGGFPAAGLVLSGGTLYGSTEGETGGEDLPGGNGTLFAVNASTMAFTNLYTFAYSDAAAPVGTLAISGNTLYGTSSVGGSGGNGVVYKVNPDGSGYAVLKSFSPFGLDPSTFAATNGDGANPEAGLVAAGGMLYGTTYYGGSNGAGTIFAVNTNGAVFTNMYTFTGGSDGGDPQGAMILAGSVLYGTTAFGGANGNGVLFSINTNGTGFAVVRSFSATTAGTNGDGANPTSGLIISGTTLYGTTSMGGNSGNGTVFSFDTSSSNFLNVHNFTGGSGGANPATSLVFYGGVLYGTTPGGGANSNGTVFMVTANGSTFATLKSFSTLGIDPLTNLSTNSDGADPYGSLTLFGNMLYGTTFSGGVNGYGTVYAVNTNGAGSGFSTIYTFSATDGANPQSGLLFSGNTLYGTTVGGGNVGDGTLFGLSLFSLPVQLSIQLVGHGAVLTWASPLFFLQSAPAANGPYTTLPGATSPYTNTITNAPQFFRLEASQ